MDFWCAVHLLYVQLSTGVCQRLMVNIVGNKYCNLVSELESTDSSTQSKEKNLKEPQYLSLGDLLQGIVWRNQ